MNHYFSMQTHITQGAQIAHKERQASALPHVQENCAYANLNDTRICYSRCPWQDGEAGRSHTVLEEAEERGVVIQGLSHCLD